MRQSKCSIQIDGLTQRLLGHAVFSGMFEDQAKRELRRSVQRILAHQVIRRVAGTDPLSAIGQKAHVIDWHRWRFYVNFARTERL